MCADECVVQGIERTRAQVAEDDAERRERGRGDMRAM
jgi:hypothetical protein